MVNCMGKVSDYFKGCWNSTPENSTDERDGPSQSEQENFPVDPQTDPDDENPPLIGIRDVYSAVIAEAERIWEDDVNCAVLRERSDRSMLTMHLGCRASCDGSTICPDRTISVGEQILRHSISMLDVHRFFLKLNPKRFLPQVDANAIPSCTGTIRTVQVGSSTRARRERVSHLAQPVLQLDIFLNEPEKSLYKRTLQCAHFPVLSSPSSEPSLTPPSSQGTRCSSSSSEGDVLSPTDKVSIEPEMLMTCLREAFGITQRIHNRYYNEVKQSIPNRDPSKLLLHELQDRFYQLETNQHNYYRIGSFLSKDGYSKWRIRQLDATKRLIRRFCKGGEMSGSLGMKVSEINAHKEYKILQEKLFKYEMQMRADSNTADSERETVSVFPVSTAAKKILKEFSLRYGVCGLHRQISALMCMAKNFQYHGWYIKCCTLAVFEVKRLLKSQYDVMVKDERNMLIVSLNLLHESIEYTLKNTKILCPKKMPFDTVSWMLEMLKAIIKIKMDLGIWDDGQPPEKEIICRLIKKAIEVGYNEIKGTILINVEIETPQMLRCLLSSLRSELNFYKEFKEHCPDISEYMDIESVAASELYSLLMKDVRAVCIQKMEPEIEDSSIDLEMLRLAYLLSKLDKDWAGHIAPSLQKWRIYFMKEVKRTMETTAFSILELIRNLISKDPCSTIEFEKIEIDNDNDRPQATPCMQSIHSSATLASVSSLVQSESSAFRKVTPKTSSSNIAAQRDGVGCFSECSNGTNGNNPDAGIPSKRKETENGRNSDKVVLNQATLAEDTNKLEVQKTGNCEVSDFDTQKDPVSNNYARGKKSLPCRNHVVRNSVERKISPDDTESSSSVYETPPSTNIDSDDKVANGSSGSFRSFSDENTQVSDFQNQIGGRTSPCGDETESTNKSEKFVSEILEEIITNVCLTEDQTIDLFIYNILENAVHSVTQEMGFSPIKFHENDGVGRKSASKSPVVVVPRPRRPSNSIAFNYESCMPKVGDCSVKKAINKRPKRLRRAFSYPATSSDFETRKHDWEYTPSGRSADTLSPEASRESTNHQRNDHNNNIFSSQLSKALEPGNTSDSSQPSLSSSDDTSRDIANELPLKGRILVSSSLIDILITIQRTSGFFKELHSLVVPTTHHPKFMTDFQKLKHEHDIFSAHLFEGLAKSIKKTLMTYADGILALDCCGFNYGDLSNVVNYEVIKRIREKQRNGLISGCSHDPNRRLSTRAVNQGVASEFCPQVLRILRFCLGECEAISPKMCIRINNLRSLIEVMEPIENHAKHVCGITSSCGESHTFMSSIINTALELGCAELRSCKENLEVIWKSQVRILAERVAVMLGKIIDVFLSLSLKWAESAPYKEQLKPISIFLKHQMGILKEYLYPVSLREVVYDIWQYVIKILHSLADNLRLNKTNPTYNSKRYIQLMSICLKYLVVDDYTADRLTALCGPVLLRFKLHSYQPEFLKLLYDISASMESEDQAAFRTASFKEVLLEMRSTGALHRVFTGAEFVDALISNKSWLEMLEGDVVQSDVENAISIGERLLNMEMISCVEKPESREEDAVRFVPSSEPLEGIPHSVIHVGHRGFIFSPDHNDDDDDGGRCELFTESEADGFYNLSTYVYQINAASSNISDVSLQICRVLKQADFRFSTVIQQDILRILEYRSYWKKEKGFIDILGILSPKNFRPKASSWPCA